MGVDGLVIYNFILLVFFLGVEYGSWVFYFIVEREIEYELGWKFIF